MNQVRFAGPVRKHGDRGRKLTIFQARRRKELIRERAGIEVRPEPGQQQGGLPPAAPKRKGFWGLAVRL